ncbi:MAG TPA: DUF1990 domain-containing protein [Streptosporangiaceae bacterium]
MRIFWLRRPSPSRISAFIAEQADRDFNYPQAGATRGQLPAGYVHDRRTVDLGPDDGARFARAAGALATWGAQRGAGMTVYPDGPAREDLTFAILLPLPVGFVTAAGRVVYVIDEPDRSGFAYGTLPAHPEQGEEAFVVFRKDGRVWFELTAFSRPRHPLATIGRPASRLMQHRATAGYIAGMRDAVSDAPTRTGPPRSTRPARS